jgi:hypothetical protein
MEVDKNGKIKLAVIGDATYENKRKIKTFLFETKKKYGTQIQIVSGGSRDGADKYVRKFCIELGLDYVEFNPAYTNKNLYSALGEEYYGKEFHGSHNPHRANLMANYADKAVVFKTADNDKYYVEPFIKRIKKLKKPIVLITEKD